MKTKLKIQFFTLAVLLHIANTTLAQSVKATPNLLNHKDWGFIENKGQLADENGKPLPDIKYYGRQGGVAVYCKSGMLSFVFTQRSAKALEANNTWGKPGQKGELKKDTITAARMELAFIGANLQAPLMAEGRQEATTNYFTANTGEKGITDLYSFKKLTYKDIYPHIDLILNAGATGLEYSMLVHPGGRVNDIKMRWNGTKEEIFKDNGDLEHYNELAKISESAPKSYCNGQLIKSSFGLKEASFFEFKVDPYDQNHDLLIDPNIEWGTYYGGSADETCYGMEMDKTGNIYITGITSSASAIATSGAYLSSLMGKRSAFIAKFNSLGNLKWATYYGGKDATYSKSIALDVNGNIFISGITWDSTGIATNGAYKTSATAYTSAFLAKFNTSGYLSWGTYFGGDKYDESNSVATDSAGNVYILCDGSSTDIATSGAYQSSNNGKDDIYLAKFSNAGGLNWATYFGGNYYEYGTCVKIDNKGNAIITGTTESTTNLATSGASQTSYQGITDVFLAKFNSAGALKWATYYGGDQYDASSCLVTDIYGNIYLTGGTKSSYPGIATSGAYKSSYVYDYDAFIAKFNESGNLVWGSYYGGDGKDYAYDICLNKSGNLLVTGNTYSTYGIVTQNAYERYPKKGGNIFIAEFSTNSRLLYGTYFGSNSNIHAAGIRTDTSSNIYITGYTDDYNTLATKSAYQNVNSGNNDIFLAKFSWNFYQNDVGIDTVINPVLGDCRGNYPVKVRLQNYGTKILKSVGIAWSMNDTVQKPYLWTGALAPGDNATITLNNSFNFKTDTNKIIAYTYKPNGVLDSFPKNDTLFKIVIFKSAPNPIVGQSRAICSGTSIQIGKSAVSGNDYWWTSIPTGYATSKSSLTVKPLYKKIYILTESNLHTGCFVVDTIVITVNPNPTPVAGKPKTICFGSNDTLGSTYIKGHTYNWTSSPAGYKSSASNPIVKPNATTFYKLTETIDSTGCSGVDSVQISVYKLNEIISGSYPSICKGDKIQLGLVATKGYSYNWVSSPSGFSSNISSPTVSPDTTTKYKVTATMQSLGCTKTDSVVVRVYNKPAPIKFLDKKICFGANTLLSVNPVSGHSYYWSGRDLGNKIQTTTCYVSPNITTKYYLTEVLDFAGCTTVDTATVYIQPLPTVGFSLKNNATDYYFNLKDSSLSKSAYKWDMGDQTTAIGYNVHHVYQDLMYYNIIVKATDSMGCQNEFDSSIGVFISSISPQTLPNPYNISIYPNPFHHKTIIHFNNPEAANVKVSVMDMMGKELFIIPAKSYVIGPNEIEIDASALAAGTYFVNVMINDALVTKKIVVMR